MQPDQKAPHINLNDSCASTEKRRKGEAQTVRTAINVSTYKNSSLVFFRVG